MARFPHNSMARRLLLWSLLLGALGGLITDLRIFVNYYFFGDSPDITTGFILNNIFNSLFAMCILITRGVVGKSRVLVLTGALSGVLIGIVTLPIGLVVNPPWPTYPIIRTGLIGLAAGLIWGISNPLSSRRLYACIAGFIGGVLGIPIFYVVSGLAVLPHTILHFFDISFQSYVLVDVMLYVGLAVNGAAHSFAIWYLILRFDMSSSGNEGQLN